MQIDIFSNDSKFKFHINISLSLFHLHSTIYKYLFYFESTPFREDELYIEQLLLLSIWIWNINIAFKCVHRVLVFIQIYPCHHTHYTQQKQTHKRCRFSYIFNFRLDKCVWPYVCGYHNHRTHSIYYCN